MGGEEKGGERKEGKGREGRWKVAAPFIDTISLSPASSQC
jgi:hypothetical protein